MAHTFVDHYRPIRAMLRVNGLDVGVGLGLLLLLYPINLLNTFGFDVGPPLMARLAGSALLGQGLGLLLAAADVELNPGTLVSTIISNGLLAITFFVTYLNGSFSHLTPLGKLLLLTLFVICLLTAVLPIPYLRRGIGL